MACLAGTSSVLGNGAIAEIERRLPPLVGCAWGLALPSATLALRVSLQALGIESDDEVVVPALDWLATSAAVRSLGARAVPADVVLPDCTVGPDAVARSITARTRAVVVSHLGGVPADATAIAGICHRHGIPLVEDAAQAAGARLDGRPVGSFGSVAVLSFGATKLLDAGGGGMLVTGDRDLWREAVRLSQHPARQLLAGIDDPNLAVLEARIHPASAVLVAAQIDGLPSRLARCHDLTRALRRQAIGAGLRTISVGDRALCTGRTVPVMGVPTDGLDGLELADLRGLLDIGRLSDPSGTSTPNAERAFDQVRLLGPTAGGNFLSTVR